MWDALAFVCCAAEGSVGKLWYVIMDTPPAKLWTIMQLLHLSNVLLYVWYI